MGQGNPVPGQTICLLCRLRRRRRVAHAALTVTATLRSAMFRQCDALFRRTLLHFGVVGRRNLLALTAIDLNVVREAFRRLDEVGR